MLVPAVSIILLAAIPSLPAIRFGHEPEPPRDHLFEADDGQRENPFADLSEGVTESQSRCKECGDVIDSPTYRVCQSCVARPIPGD